MKIYGGFLQIFLDSLQLIISQTLIKEARKGFRPISAIQIVLGSFKQFGGIFLGILWELYRNSLVMCGC